MFINSSAAWQLNLNILHNSHILLARYRISEQACYADNAPSTQNWIFLSNCFA